MQLCYATETKQRSTAYQQINPKGRVPVLGDQFSLADPYFYILNTWLVNNDADSTQFPKLTAFIKQMAARSFILTVTAQGML
ncbi:MAG: hypothetical protein JKY94_13810 [Rhodobacteraceae bacterium]|nr:hypothetical protein [Paracoccaceae bacterium]